MKILGRNGKEIKTNTPESTWRSKAKNFTVAALFSLLPLTSCDDNSVNNKITVNRNDLYVECVVKHKYSGGGSGDPTEFEYKVSFRKEGDIYTCEIVEDLFGPYNPTNTFDSADLNDIKGKANRYLTGNNSKLPQEIITSTIEKIDITADALDSMVNNRPLPENKNGKYTFVVK